jgi:hypothetical protein
LAVDIHSPGHEPRLLTKRARTSDALATAKADDVALVVAVA